MNLTLTPIRDLAQAAMHAQLTSTDDALEIEQALADLNHHAEVMDEDGSVREPHLAAARARELVALCARVLDGQAERIGAHAEPGYPGATQRLRDGYDAKIAAARAAL
jgi:hypothetical protein